MLPLPKQSFAIVPQLPSRDSGGKLTCGSVPHDGAGVKRRGDDEAAVEAEGAGCDLVTVALQHALPLARLHIEQVNLKNGKSGLGRVQRFYLYKR